MRSKLNHFFQTEVFKYLFFGVLATVVYLVCRLVMYAISGEATLSALVANVAAILFAFVTNDIYVFNQVRQGWLQRFIKFVIARIFTLLLDVFLAYLLVEKFPSLIGKFVHHNLSLVNTIETLLGQVLVIILNYILSKLFIFKNSK
ncbi:GtrA family protein [Streptococcus uberis]|uniref:GtrA family protein n=1 Tax=Streptococcus uberis TaxID=1349 RepID=UPI00054331C5|nr:GtrA family protein [Streptococcus uberis]KHD41200.1 sugar translocase [Streptococcus hongkongensis]MCR4256992.1 GtrA family protein [Streptococcus uberis]SQG46077.1 GtrA-like protein [Streptococcus uberis]